MHCRAGPISPLAPTSPSPPDTIGPVPPALDPQIAHWLGTTPPADVDVADIEAVRRMADDYMRETGGPGPRCTPDTVEVTHSTIGGVPVTTWQSRAQSRADCVVVAAHGGGFIVGSALGAERIAVPLALHHGITTVSVDYRLAPEHRAPAALHDVIKVVRGLSHRRIALHGSSAGGCLVAGTALWARDNDITLAGQVLSCPALDHHVIDQVWSPTWTSSAAHHMWQHYLGDSPQTSDPLWPYVIPATQDNLADVAPAHVVIAEHDVLRSQAIAYSHRLHQAGVEVCIADIPGTVHGFDGLLPDCDVASRALTGQVEAIAGWLREETGVLTAH